MKKYLFLLGVFLIAIILISGCDQKTFEQDKTSVLERKTDQKFSQTNTTPSPRIVAVYGNNEHSYTITFDHPEKSMWLCIQQDWYSKPDNETCNYGELIEQAPYKIIYPVIGNEAILRLLSYPDQDTLYDQVLITRNKDNTFKLSPISSLCGKLQHDKMTGNFYLNRKRLLTEPGWKSLLSYKNTPVCVEGMPYKKTFRVYFIKEQKI